MLSKSSELFAWLNLVNCLHGSGRQPSRKVHSRSMHKQARTAFTAFSSAGDEAPISVRIVDRNTPTTVIVEWCDATSCRYGSQLWRTAKAKRAGICALTGTAIKNGDAIYRPRSSKQKPQNAAAMICAAHVEQIPCNDA